MAAWRKLQRLSSLHLTGLSAVRLASSRAGALRALPIARCDAERPAEADISRVLVLGTLGAAAVSAGAWLFRRHADGPVADRIYPRDWRYLCEGRRFLLVAAKAADKPRDWGGYVLQLRKSTGSMPEKPGDVYSLEWQTATQRLLSKAGFPPLFLNLPEAVVVPVADVRSLDAHLLSARPQDLRKQRLDVQEANGQVAKVQLLRKENLLDAWAPSLSLELAVGCGVKELTDVPSRHSMAYQLAHGKVDQDRNLALFSKSAKDCANAVSNLMSGSIGCEIFASGGEHVGGDAKAREELLQRVGLSSEEVAEAAAAILANPDSILDYLKKLQVFATGNAERLAGQMLSELQKREGDRAGEGLLCAKQLEAALAKAPREASVDAHEKEALRLLSASRWRAREVEAAQRWLSLFLLGRGAFHAKVLINLVRHPKDAELPGSATARFRPLSTWLPGKSWSSDFVVRVTLVGLEPAPLEEIELCAAELETLVEQYQAAAKM